jgi:hypothetical protein
VNRQKYMYRKKLYYLLKSKAVDEINSNLFSEKGEPDQSDIFLLQHYIMHSTKIKSKCLQKKRRDLTCNNVYECSIIIHEI